VQEEVVAEGCGEGVGNGRRSIPSLLVACRYIDLKRWYMSNVELTLHQFTVG
jgi:hypothetical protein